MFFLTFFLIFDLGKIMQEKIGIITIGDIILNVLAILICFYSIWLLQNHRDKIIVPKFLRPTKAIDLGLNEIEIPKQILVYFLILISYLSLIYSFYNIWN